MLNLLTVNKSVFVNGVEYASAQDALSALQSFDGKIEILINAKAQNAPVAKLESVKTDDKTIMIYRIEVRKYMTEKSSPGFNFMKEQNGDVPMPLRRMYGEILEETKGMYKMALHARAERDAVHCSHCMRALSHPISKIYGIGPICGEHDYFASDYTKSKIKDEDQLFKLADAELRKTTWTGWIPKSAIQSFREVEEVKAVKKVRSIF